MFGGGAANPYDELVTKATDENLTTENWELILNVCDKVGDDGTEGARNVITAILKRLAHRNPNVQLYALSLAESLQKNLGIEVHQEIASKAFTQGLEKLITDRTTHEKVRRRTLGLIATWTAEFQDNATLGVMEDCYNSLKSKNYKFETPQEAPPPTVDDEIRRKEEEELQRVLEMSMQDKGGRGQWSSYSAVSSSGVGVSGSSSSANRTQAASSSTSEPAAAPSSSSTAYSAPKYQAGYVPARTPSPKTSPQTQTFPTQVPPATTSVDAAGSLAAAAPSTPASQLTIVTRVRALHTFEPTEPGELAFEKGDIIKVVDRGYKDWWRGQLKGRTGIFPVNYVEPMPEPTPAELAREAEQEAAVFSQAVNVEKLLTMLRSLDPAKDNLADNEEIQELYRSCMALRPKIVKLIDKYSQKRADLVSMNETFVRARTIFDRTMEESLARHTGVYDQSGYRPPAYRPDSRGRAGQEYAHSSAVAGPSYAWNHPYEQAGYPAAFPAAAPAPVASVSPPGPQPYADPNAAAYAQAQAGYAAPGYVGQQPSVPYGPQGPTPYPVQVQPLQPQTQAPTVQPHPQPQPQPQVQMQAVPQPQSQLQQSPQQQPTQLQQPQQQPQIQQQTSQFQQPQPQSIQQQQQPQQAAAHSQPQATAAAGTQQQTQAAGPPYVYDPNATYADPNVQAWAQYYAKGGKDPAGSVYFVSVPGLTDAAPPASPSVPQHQGPQQSQAQAQAHQPVQPQQQQQQPTQYQAQQAQPLQQQHQQQVQPQSSYGQSTQPQHTTQASTENLPYPGESNPAELPYPGDQSGTAQHQHYQPALANATSSDGQFPSQAPLTSVNSYASTTSPSAAPLSLANHSAPLNGSPNAVAAATPSWVLPKRADAARVGASQAAGGAPPGYGAHNPDLTHQFAGMNVADAEGRL